MRTKMVHWVGFWHRLGIISQALYVRLGLNRKSNIAAATTLRAT